MCNDGMPVSVKVYYGQPSASAVEIRRFVFRPEQQQKGRPGAPSSIFQALVERIRSVFNGLNLHDLHLCWKDDDGDYVVFSSDDELRVAISSTNDNTLRIYIRAKELPTRLTRRPDDPNDIDGSGYARISRRGDSSRRHHRRPTRSASASRESEISTPITGRRRPALSKDRVDHLREEYSTNGQSQSNGTSEYHTSNNHVDSGTSTSSGVVEESSETMKESSNEDNRGAIAVCSECRGEGRRGILYQCTVCQDFFLCSECENRGLHDQHIMLRIKTTNGPGDTQDGFHR